LLALRWPATYNENTIADPQIRQIGLRHAWHLVARLLGHVDSHLALLGPERESSPCEVLDLAMSDGMYRRQGRVLRRHSGGLCQDQHDSE
jgi:hypothetical protein